VAAVQEQSSRHSINAVLCVGRDAFDRFRGVFRHLLVGLIDQAVAVRILSDYPRAQTLSLGPIQTVIHEPIVWPFRNRRIDQVLDAISVQAPTSVHAASRTTYALGRAIADAYEADLFLQVNSLADCEALRKSGVDKVGRFFAVSQPLAAALTDQLRVPAEQVVLVRPGVLAAQEAACFADLKAMPSILCLSGFDRESGVERLIEATDLLRQRGHTFMVFLLGRGPTERAIRRMIRERKLSAFVTIARPAGDLSDAMRSADLFVRPSADTIISVASVEAMGAGLACVSVPAGVGDHFRGGETAILCDKLSAAALADAIEKLLTDRELARRLAVAGMEYVRANHAASTMAQITADAYRKLALSRAALSIRE